MIDFKHARENMVDCQVRTSDVTEHALISAMLSVPREEFVPSNMTSLAYIDEDINLDKIAGSGRYLMQAASFAKLAQMAQIEETDFVLVVGTGSGYSSAVLSLMASSVVTIEEDAELAKFASEKLAELGFTNVAVLVDDLETGYAKEAPFDVIFFDGAIQTLPEAFFNQLAEGGRLICVEGLGNAASAKVYLKRDGIVSDRKVTNCAIKPLPGFIKKEEFAL